MKILVPIFFLFFFTSVFGQTASDEISRLKQHLGVDQNTKVELSTTSRITALNRPMKVFIATGLDLGIRNNYLRWLENWNKSGDSKKFGKMEVVESIDQADYVLARYTLNEQARTESSSQVTPGVVWDPNTNTTITRPVSRTYSYARVPVFAYVLVRSEETYKIIYRYSSSADLGEFKNSGSILWDDFKKMVKKR